MIMAEGRVGLTADKQGLKQGLLWWLRWESTGLQRGRPGFSPWVGKEKEMATHSNILAWRIPWTEEPGGLHFTAPQMSTRLSETVAEGLAELRAPGMGDLMSQWIGEWIFEDTGK